MCKYRYWEYTCQKNSTRLISWLEISIAKKRWRNIPWSTHFAFRPRQITIIKIKDKKNAGCIKVDSRVGAVNFHIQEWGHSPPWSMNQAITARWLIYPQSISVNISMITIPYPFLPLTFFRRDCFPASFMDSDIGG